MSVDEYKFTIEDGSCSIKIENDNFCDVKSPQLNF